MNRSDRLIVVAGATGRQGGAVARHLLERGWRVRGLTRNPQSARARALGAAGAELARADLDEPASLTPALAGAYGAFSVQNFWEVGAAREIQQGKHLADAARTAAVRHFVFASVGGAERQTGIEHFESKFAVEEHIRALGLPVTIVRPVGFMENYYIPAVEKGLLKGRLMDPVAPEKSFQLIATDDIGKFVALVFERPEEFIGRAIEIGGDVVTNPEVAAIFSRVMRRPVRFRRLPLLLVRVVLGREFYQMFRWFNESGFAADIEGLRASYPEVGWTRLEEWVRREGWDRKDPKYVRHEKTFDVTSPRV